MFESMESDCLYILIDILFVCVVIHSYFDTDSTAKEINKVDDLVGCRFKHLINGAIWRAAYIYEWQI